MLRQQNGESAFRPTCLSSEPGLPASGRPCARRNSRPTSSWWGRAGWKVPAASAAAFNLLKLAGAAYLLYLAWLSFRSGLSKASLQGARFPGYVALYRRGVIMNVTNPKVTLFFLAFLPQFADPARGSLTVQIVVLGALFQLATLLVFGSVSLLAGRMAERFNSSVRGQLWLNRAAGCVFTGLGLMLIASSR